MRACYAGLALVLGAASPAWAGKQVISTELREQAMQFCTGDAMRLCLASLMDEEQTTRCMSANRSQLSPSCRVVFDRGNRSRRR